MNSGVYQLIFPDGTFYIGGSSRIKQRIQTHLSWLRKGVGQTAELQQKFDSFGKPLQKVVLYCSNKNIAMYEKLIANALKPELSKNTTPGAVGVVISDIARKNMSEAAKRKNQKCQSGRQLETWKDPDIIEARRTGMIKAWETRRLDTLICPCCGKTINRNVAHRYHFDNCKRKNHD